MTFYGKVQRPDTKIIDNQPFFPAMDLSVLINQYRTPVDLPDLAVETNLRVAMGHVNSRLEPLRRKMREQGFDSLEEIPSEKIGDVSIAVDLYTRAVMYQAKGWILRDWPSIDRRDAAENQARSGEQTEDRYLECSDQAIAKLLGLREINVELL